MIECGKVIRDAAVRNGVIVYGDGVEMLFTAVLNIMLDNLGAAVAAALEVCRDGHAEAVRRWRRDAEARADGILGVAFDAGKDAASEAIREAADSAAIAVRGEFAASVSRQREDLDAVVSGMRRHAFLVLAAHGVLLAGAAFVLFL